MIILLCCFFLYSLIYVLHPSGSNFAYTLIDASTFCMKIMVMISLLCLYDLKSCYCSVLCCILVFLPVTDLIANIDTLVNLCDGISIIIHCCWWLYIRRYSNSYSRCCSPIFCRIHQVHT